MRLVGFGHNYATVHLSRQSFLAYGRTKQGIASLSPPVVASLLLIHLQKKNYFIFGIRTRAARVKGFPEIKCFPSGSNLGNGHSTSRAFLFPLGHRGSEIWDPLPPEPAHRRFADPSGNILGSKLCTGATFYSYLLNLLFLSLLILLFLYLNLFVVYQTCILII